MADTAIQLYSLRNVEQPFPELLSTVAAAGFEGVEFANRVRNHPPARVHDWLDDAGLAAVGAHVDIDDIEADVDQTISFFQEVGTRELVVPWLAQEHFESAEAARTTGERLDALSERLHGQDMVLHYHNHAHEFVSIDDTTGFDEFIASSTVPIELDVGFVEEVGRDPAAMIRTLDDRCRLLHLKDVNPTSGESVPVGEGALDVAATAAAFNDVEGEWLIYEYEGTDPLETLATVGDRINGLE